MPIKAPKLIYNNGSQTNLTKVYEWNGRKFRIRCKHENGTPLGFNSNCALYVMTSDGLWKGIADNHELNVKWENLYYSFTDDPRKGIENNRAVAAFIEYLKEVY
jgi:hypothetical protein